MFLNNKPEPKSVDIQDLLKIWVSKQFTIQTNKTNTTRLVPARKYKSWVHKHLYILAVQVMRPKVHKILKELEHLL